MFGLWAAHRWSLPAAVILWIALTSTFWLIGDRNPRVRAHLYRIARHDGRPASEPDYEHYFVRHPLADWQRLKLWPKCWQLPRSDRERYILWDQLRRLDGHEAAFSWVELDEVAEFLRSRHVGDRELIAWHDTPHVLYLMLGIEPGLRYMHVNTAQGISDAAHARVQAELAAAAGVALRRQRPRVSGDLLLHRETLAAARPTHRRPDPPAGGARRRIANQVPVQSAGDLSHARRPGPVHRARTHAAPGGFAPTGQDEESIALINKSGAANAPADEAAQRERSGRKPEHHRRLWHRRNVQEDGPAAITCHRD